MANLIRLTVTEINKLTNVGSYSFNILRIKKIHSLGAGSLIYYSNGSDKQSSVVKISIYESPSTINAQLTGSLDFQIPLNVLSINGIDHIVTENVKTTDIILGMIDVNTSYSTLLISDISLNSKKYLVNNTLSSIETSANNYSIGGGSGSVIWGIITGTLSDQTDLTILLGDKVDKVTGKALSTNDYDNTEKANVAFSTPITIAYTTTIPFTRALTIITGKSLTTSDVFTIASDPVEGGGIQTWLVGDGSHSPDFTAFDYQSGTYSTTAEVYNLITIEYLGGNTFVSILNMTTI
jgi:hypothetical protein